MPSNTGATYDWIGFDPRGVGASSPSLSCIPDYFGYNRPYYVPVTRALERAWLERAEPYADACERNAAALLPHMKTTDSARDMESIRKALGASQINYYGFSYGTYLAQVYATLFPSRVRRMVLDANAFWPAPAGKPVRVDGHHVPGILLISETLDAATPFSGSLEVRRRFRNASLIAVAGGTSHANSLNGNACVDDQIAAYLADGTLPTRRPGNRPDAICAPLPQPEPNAAAASTAAAGSGVTTRLRPMLAQR